MVRPTSRSSASTFPAASSRPILATAEGGTVIFFSMATSFAAAALGAEGLAADVTMLVGNGYVPGHAASRSTCCAASRPSAPCSRPAWPSDRDTGRLLHPLRVTQPASAGNTVEGLTFHRSVSVRSPA